ncbi:MAG: hypothetical protein EBQ96_09585 [Proteobacteria bacterium]|nr:hypothetical protein [Pseudomonadota bacterium]
MLTATLYSNGEPCTTITQAPQGPPNGLGCALGTNGKPRRRYRHASKWLKDTQVQKLHDAALEAWKAGRPLNRFVTIHLKDSPAQRNPQAFTNALMEKTRKWLKRRKLPHAYVWVLENGPDKGIHLHLLQHIPAGHQADYRKALTVWLPFEAMPPRVVIKTVGYPPHGGIHERSRLAGVLRYMCKGIRKPHAGIRPVYQGEITGRRCGVSRMSKEV